jgi:hypothetical protein
MEKTKIKKRKRRPKLTLEQVSQFFAEHDCTLISKSYLSNKQILRYRCNKCGKMNVGCYNNLSRIGRQSKQRYFCKHCWLKKIGDGKTLKRIELRQKLFSIIDAAAYLGVEYSDFYNHVRYKKTLPTPTRIATASGRQRFYSEDDLKEIRNMIILRNP